jgi:hypothetical protein
MRLSGGAHAVRFIDCLNVEGTVNITETFFGWPFYREELIFLENFSVMSNS